MFVLLIALILPSTNHTNRSPDPVVLSLALQIVYPASSWDFLVSLDDSNGVVDHGFEPPQNAEWLKWKKNSIPKNTSDHVQNNVLAKTDEKMQALKT